MILDIALFIIKLLRENRHDLVDKLLDLYYAKNKKIEYDKKLLFTAAIIMVYCKDDENLINNYDLNKFLSNDVSLVRNYFKL